MIAVHRSCARLFAGRSRLNQRGQTLAEVGLVLPLLMILMIGMLQVGFLLYQGHVVRKVAREAANMLSRQVTLDETAAAIHDYGVPHVGPFDANAMLVLSVLQVGTAGSNAGAVIISQRRTIGTLTGVTSRVGNPAQSAYATTANRPALDPAEDSTIRATTPLPHGLTLQPNDVIFVAELYIQRKDIAPILWPISITFPNSLYANAFF